MEHHNGSADRVCAVIFATCAGDAVDLEAAGPSPACVAGLLKQYLRDMLEPILTDALLMTFYRTLGTCTYKVQAHVPRARCSQRIMLSPPAQKSRTAQSGSRPSPPSSSSSRRRTPACCAPCSSICGGAFRPRACPFAFPPPNTHHASISVSLACRRVRAREQANKMTMQQLGIVFAPLLQIPAPLFALFLTEFDRLFPAAAPAVEPAAETPAPVSL